MRVPCASVLLGPGRGFEIAQARLGLALGAPPRAHSSLHADGTIGALFHYERCGLGPRCGRCALETPLMSSVVVCHTNTASETKNEEVAFLHPQRGKAQATLESNVTKKTFLQRHPRTGLRAGRARGVRSPLIASLIRAGRSGFARSRGHATP